MNDNEKIKELEATIDSYGIQLLLMKAQFATLESGLMNLANSLLDDKANQDFLKDHFQTLKARLHEINTLPDFPFSQTTLLRELIEFELYANRQLQKLK